VFVAALAYAKNVRKLQTTQLFSEWCKVAIGMPIASTILKKRGTIMKIAFLLLIGIVSIKVSAESTNDCKRAKFDDFSILETLAQKRRADEGVMESKVKWINEYNKICAEAKCLMARDKIAFEEFKSRVIKTGKTPFMKKMMGDAFEELDIKTCSQ
jgi:hypothetical protein